MANRKKSPAKTSKSRTARKRGILGWGLRISAGIFLVLVFAIVLFAVFNPPTTIYIAQEGRRLGKAPDREWVPFERMAPVMIRSVVAAEDANFCIHWGFDLPAIKKAIEDGGTRGASTLSQQVVKNVYLWHGRTYSRKAMEAVMTPLLELIWSKRRILEVYLNVAEFDEGVFGVEAAARHYFGTTAAELSPVQAARLAALLPDPKGRSAAKPSNFVRKRAAQIMDGASTIEADGRARCFQG